MEPSTLVTPETWLQSRLLASCGVAGLTLVFTALLAIPDSSRVVYPRRLMFFRLVAYVVATPALLSWAFLAPRAKRV